VITLETETDRTGEQATINRFIERCGPNYQAIGTLPFAIIDYALIHNNRITNYLEIKNRKESRDQVQQYGGLMLKHRKVLELHALAEQMKTPTHVVYGFNSGHGEIWIATVSDLIGLMPQDPPRRRNYRGLACDEEPVIYLDWSLDVKRVA
jgi:hypothetical protein